MAGLEIGDVGLVHTPTTGLISVEAVSIQEGYILARHTEAPLSQPYHVLWSELQPWDGVTPAIDSLQAGLKFPVESITRMLERLRSCTAPSLMQAKGLTIDHLVNLCFRCDLSVASDIEVACAYLHTVLQTCFQCLEMAFNSPKMLAFVLGLMRKVMAKGVIVGSRVYEGFLQLRGKEISIEIANKIERLFRENADYLSTLRLIPLFHTHKRLPVDCYRTFVEVVVTPFRNYNFRSVLEAKQTLRYLEELDYCLHTYGFKSVLEPSLAYAIKRYQTAICMDLLAIQPTRFDAIESFSALLKSNSRDKQYRLILQEFNYSVGQLSALISGLPDYMQEYFIKACCLGSFSIDSLFSYMGSDKQWSPMLSVEFFTELLQYNSTQFLRKLPQSDIEFCKKSGENIETQMLSYGIEFNLLKLFYPEFVLNKDRLLIFASSKYSEFDKAKVLFEHFRFSDKLLGLLAVQEDKDCKAKGQLLSLYYNAGVVQGMWIREHSRWSRVPLALFVRAFSEFY